jgi:hypothetical protein
LTAIAYCNYSSMMSTEVLDLDPTLAVAERQLVLLGELVEIAMAATRAFGSSAAAAAQAETMILGQEWFTPEVGRARACGAKDAADSLQKVTRAVRLTMKLQMTVAEIVRDIRAGVVTYSNPAETPRSFSRSAGVLAGSSSGDRDSDWTRSETNTERLVEFEPPETLPHAPFRETVDTLCADVAATVDWARWKIEAPAPGYDTLHPGPLEQSASPDRSRALPTHSDHPGECRDPDRRSECPEFSG